MSVPIIFLPQLFFYLPFLLFLLLPRLNFDFYLSLDLFFFLQFLSQHFLGSLNLLNLLFFLLILHFITRVDPFIDIKGVRYVCSLDVGITAIDRCLRATFDDDFLNGLWSTDWREVRVLLFHFEVMKRCIILFIKAVYIEISISR